MNHLLNRIVPSIAILLICVSMSSVLAQDWDTATPAPTSTLIPTNTPLPTATVTPTATNIPPGWNTATPIPQNTIVNPSPYKRAIILSLEGLRTDALDRGYTPNIRLMINEGAWDAGASTVYPPNTLASHVSMLTGLPVGEHGYSSDEFLLDTLNIPTILSILEDAGFDTATVIGNQRLTPLEQEDAAFSFATYGDREVSELVLDYLDQGVEVIFAHFPNADFFGHRDGWMTSTYLQELRFTDTRIGSILFKLEQLGIQDETLVILTANRGGIGKSSDVALPEVMEVPWIVLGNNVRAGKVVENVDIEDTAPTVLWALGLPVPAEMPAPVYEIFDIGESGFE